MGAGKATCTKEKQGRNRGKDGRNLFWVSILGKVLEEENRVRRYDSRLCRRGWTTLWRCAIASRSGHRWR